MTTEKIPSVIGPLRELILHERPAAERFYNDIADLCEEVMGDRARASREISDPIEYMRTFPTDLYTETRFQIQERTSLLIVVPVAPCWNFGGMEIEMAYRAGVPVLFLKDDGLPFCRQVLGCPAVKHQVVYQVMQNGNSRYQDALRRLKPKLTEIHEKSLGRFVPE